MRRAAGPGPLIASKNPVQELTGNADGAGQGADGPGGAQPPLGAADRVTDPRAGGGGAGLGRPVAQHPGDHLGNTADPLALDAVGGSFCARRERVEGRAEIIEPNRCVEGVVAGVARLIVVPGVLVTDHPDPVVFDIDYRGVVDDAGPAAGIAGACRGAAAGGRNLGGAAGVEQEDVDDCLVPWRVQQVGRLPVIEEAAGGRLVDHRVHERTAGRGGHPHVVPALVPDQMAGACAPVTGLDGVFARVDIRRIAHHLRTHADPLMM